MRRPNTEARERLPGVLRRCAGMAAAELAAALGVSVPTLHRLLQEQAASVVAAGRARRARYALRRPLRGDIRPLPLYRIDLQGRAHALGELALLAPQGSWLQLAGSDWPVPDESRDGWWDGLPYPLHDMRPQGFLGRQLVRAEHRALDLPANPDSWDDDDVVLALSRIGHDASGHLILGDAAFERWQAGSVAPPTALPARGLAAAYARLAEQAIATGVPGSSAAGEFPKFPALRDLAGSATPHVLVKFSGADGSAAVQRWADLLVCEHLAGSAVAALSGIGIASARSRLLLHAGRTCLEVERFDRHGLFGRSPLASLGTLDAALLGDGAADWPRLAERLHGAGWLPADDVLAIQRLWWFGRLIANSDMHAGNLSFVPQGGGLRLAPAYDMLPMLYAPLPGGELPRRSFEPPLPRPVQRPAWQAACAAALAFWQAAAADGRISEAFRQQARDNGSTLQRVAERV
jgi:hypothetical protein